MMTRIEEDLVFLTARIEKELCEFIEKKDLFMRKLREEVDCWLRK